MISLKTMCADLLDESAHVALMRTGREGEPEALVGLRATEARALTELGVDPGPGEALRLNANYSTAQGTRGRHCVRRPGRGSGCGDWHLRAVGVVSDSSEQDPT